VLHRGAHRHGAIFGQGTDVNQQRIGDSGKLRRFAGSITIAGEAPTPAERWR
jgi:hypothetical protein